MQEVYGGWWCLPRSACSCRAKGQTLRIMINIHPLLYSYFCSRWQWQVQYAWRLAICETNTLDVDTIPRYPVRPCPLQIRDRTSLIVRYDTHSFIPLPTSRCCLELVANNVLTLASRRYDTTALLVSIQYL